MNESLQKSSSGTQTTEEKRFPNQTESQEIVFTIHSPDLKREINVIPFGARINCKYNHLLIPFDLANILSVFVPGELFCNETRSF